MTRLIILFTFLPFVFSAQIGEELITTESYEKAEAALSWNTSTYVDRMNVRPQWTSDNKFWYKVLDENGPEWVLYDLKSLERKTAKHEEDITKGLPEEEAFVPYDRRREVISPDKKTILFIRDWNLWKRDVASQEETPLTKDGVENFGYATDNAGWRHSDRPIVAFSKDSRKIATYQQDQRHVSDMFLVSTNVGAPELKKWKYPLPEDDEVIKIQRVIIDLETGDMTRLKLDPEPRRGTLCDDISCTGEFDDNEWNEDGSKLYFVSSSRDHKIAQLRVADANTGKVENIYKEEVATQYESGQGTINWKILDDRNEFIWYSEKDNWGHLYMHDLSSGRQKHQITKGDFVVMTVRHLDLSKEKIYFEAQGKEDGRDPYYKHFYSIDFAGSNLKLLTPEDGNHSISFSPNKEYFVDNFSKPDVPPISVLRNMDGELLATLEKTDISRLLETGWTPPENIKVKSADGNFDLYGLLFKPKDFDPKKKYPIINYIYPGPQGGSVRGRSFRTGRGDHQALAELGFIVVAIDGSCNPGRSKAFHDACYGDMSSNTLPDQMAGMEQLAEERPYIDLSRVGIWGHSGGGFATASALFKYPDFFHVGISESGNHDNRNYEDDWGERYNGLLEIDKTGKDNYEMGANQMYAENLKGKLLLAHGGMDDNVPPYNTNLVVDALIKANKDFDLIMFPNARHGYGNDSYYMMRRRWDYFVKHLLNKQPPIEYEIKYKSDPRNERV